MTDTTTPTTTVRPIPQPGPPPPTGWTGWVIFAGVIMMMIGVFQVIEALTALFRHSYYVVGHDDLLVRVNYTGWGWIHLIIGVVIIAAGGGLLLGKMWARVLGVIFAGLSAVANLIFIAAYPFWSLTVIFLDIVVIYAISVHGRELQT